jgi:4-carboxymuconolactone decarboxylase
MLKNLLIFIMSMTTISTFAANTLTERQLHLATLASLEAQGDLKRLEPAVAVALDHGVTINEIKEAFSQLYAYTGFPRSLNALGVLNKVLDTRKKEGKHDVEGKEWKRPTEWNDAKAALELGTANQTKLSGGKPFNYTFCPQDDYYLKAHLFGDIFAGDQLSAADREIVTVAALASLKGVEPQLKAHQAGAVNMGNTKQQVDELMMYLSKNGLSQCDSSAEANAGTWPKGNPNTAYAKYFTGNSHLSPIAPKNLSKEEQTVLPLSNVTFEPKCRNNWHIHHGARQILICVSGRGWYQEWGKEAIPLHAGDVIDIPEGVKHWHGAQKDSWFQHVVTHIKTSGEESNEWLEPVADDDYNKL